MDRKSNQGTLTKAVYATPIGKKAINGLVEGAAVAVGGFIANEILDWID